MIKNAESLAAVYIYIYVHFTNEKNISSVFVPK